MKLSILIPTLPSRLKFFTRLMEVLEPQLTPEVELLWLGDAPRRRPLGDKRNELLRMAQGKYVCFLDDDDRIESDLVQCVLAAAESDPDVIVFDILCSINGGKPKLCKYGLEYEYTENDVLWTGKPSHVHPYRRSIAQRCLFPSKNVGEDFDFVAQAWPQCSTQARIEKVLYHYDFDKRTTETRKRR